MITKITHKDGSISFTSGNIRIIKNKENIEDLKIKTIDEFPKEIAERIKEPKKEKLGK